MPATFIEISVAPLGTSIELALLIVGLGPLQERAV